MGILCRGVKKNDLARGMVLCAAKSQQLCNHFDASIYMLARNEGGRSKPIISKYTQILFSQTWSIPCRIDLRKSNRILRFSPGRNY